MQGVNSFKLMVLNVVVLLLDEERTFVLLISPPLDIDKIIVPDVSFGCCNILFL